jgi:transglutaminase-like putative cysteine protease
VTSERRRWIAVAATAVALIAMFPIAGVPLAWVRHVRLEVTANAIGQGLSALPNVLVPYLGINHWVRVVIVLGAAVLLFDAALLMAFTGPRTGELRRAATALPLIALAVVPSTIAKPQLPYLQGLVLFALLAAFMWADRAPVREGASTMLVVAIAGVGGVFIAPRIDSHRPWFDYRAIATTLAPSHVARFDWSQTYGPLVWPHRGLTVFAVQAARPEYWKTENLEAFNGRVWSDAKPGSLVPPGYVSPSALVQWTQTIQVTIRAMRTNNVIAAGQAQTPSDVPGGATPGDSLGTWVAGSTLAPGSSYRLRVYAPSPSPAQLASAGTSYGPGLTPYLTLSLPVQYSNLTIDQPITFAAFAGGNAITVGQNQALIDRSPYARADALALKLKRGAATPYAFAERVLAHFHTGYTYSTDPRSGLRYPLESFLFKTRVGYCQQFAGAMAMLLRMGGVPARVAVGFMPGKRDPATHDWVVTDIEAHAWVEAWFPGYGWVTFDPTPPASATTSSSPALPGGSNNRSGIGSAATGKNHATPSQAAHGRHGGSLSAWVVIAPLALVLAALLGVLWLKRSAAGSGDDLLAELERALRRSGRPVADGFTLAALERQLHGSPDASAYVRALRLRRYGGARAVPTGSQRRALRAALAGGRGAVGRLRAWWALPPRRVRSE